MKFLGLVVIKVWVLGTALFYQYAVVPVAALSGPFTRTRVARRVSYRSAVPSDPAGGGDANNDDGVSMVAPLAGVSPEFLSEKEQKMMDLYQEWRSKCGQGHQPLDPQ